MYTKTTHIVKASHPREPSTVWSSIASLEIAVDEYVVHGGSPRGLTLLFTHGTSFNKSLWEPTIVRLLHSLASPGRIHRVLAIDATNHGESWLLNANRLTQKSHWPDQSRDILTVLLHFKIQQPVIGVGHSFGGGILCHAAFLDAKAFLATVFVDPILFRMESQDEIIAQRALRRNSRWDDFESAKSAFENHKAFRDWHPEVLALYVRHGTVGEGSQGTSSRVLTTPKEQEAATYLAAPFPDLPGYLEVSKQIHYFILGAQSVVIPEEKREWIQNLPMQPPGRVEVLGSAGHLIPMTHPDQLVSKLAEMITEVSDEFDRLEIRRHASHL